MNTEPELRDKTSHYLTRLGIVKDVQALFFDTFSYDNVTGGINFEYGDDEYIEHYGFAFHKIPSSPTLWKAGCLDDNIVTDVIIGSSALNIIAYLSKQYKSYTDISNILCISVGSRVFNSHLDLIKRYKNKKITLVFDNDFLGKIADIKVACALAGFDVKFTLDQDQVYIEYRGTSIGFDLDKISLHSFKKAFKNARITKLRTHKSKGLNFVEDHIKLAF